MSSIRIEFGALALKISEQLHAQGVMRGILTKKQLDFFQQYADALQLLLVGDVLPQASVSRGRERLFKRVVNAINFAYKQIKPRN